MNINLESLKISGFMDMGDNEVIHFSPNTIYGILGKNEDTGASNGSGKSTFLNALYAGILGSSFLDIPMADIKNRNLDITPTVEVGLNIKGQTLLIKRQFNGKLKVFLDNEELAGSVAELNKKILEIIGLTAEQFVQLTYKRQGKSDFFLLMKDSAKKEYLSDLLNVEFVNQINEFFRNEYNALDKEIISLNNQLETNRTNKEYVTKHSTMFGPSKNDAIDKKTNAHTQLLLLNAGKYQYESLLKDFTDSEFFKKNQLDKVESQNKFAKALESLQVQQALDEIIKPDVSVLELELKQLEAQEKELTAKVLEVNEINAQIKLKQNNIISQEKELKRNTLDRQTVETQITALQKNLCFECNQVYHSDDIKEKIIKTDQKLVHLQTVGRSIELDIEASKAEIFALEIKLTSLDLSSIKQQIVSVMESKKNINNQIITLESSFKEALKRVETQQQLYRQSVAIARNSHESEIQKIDKIVAEEESKISNQIKDLDKQIKALESSIIDQDSIIKKIDLEEEKMKQSIVDLESAYVALQSSVSNKTNEKVILEKALASTSNQGFVSHLFDDLLLSLSNKATENFCMIPLTEGMSIEFSSEKDLKSRVGSVKQISYKLVKNGHQEINFDSLSGGEKLCVLLAIEEGLSDVLQEKLGVQLGWQILDEQMMYVDYSNKEALMEFFTYRAEKRTYFIVDHASELNTGFAKTITISKKDGIATYLTN